MNTLTVFNYQFKLMRNSPVYSPALMRRLGTLNRVGWCRNIDQRTIDLLFQKQYTYCSDNTYWGILLVHVTIETLANYARFWMRVRPTFLTESNTYSKKRAMWTYAVLKWNVSQCSSPQSSGKSYIWFGIPTGKTTPFCFLIQCEFHKSTNAKISRCINGIIKYTMQSLKQ